MRYVIIGTGAAGITAASEIRKLDSEANIVMVTSDSQAHSRCMLHKYLSHERTAAELDFTEQDFFEKQGITVVTDKVTGIDPQLKIVSLESGHEVAYNRLLIATGAQSIVPPVGDLRKADNVSGLRDLSDAQKIDKMAEHAEQILVIGSGLVGLDAAYGLMERGKKITVVEMASQILPLQLDKKAAKAYQDKFEQAGVTFRLGSKVEDTVCSEDGKICEVILDSGERIRCDFVIAATGVRPAVGFLNGSSIVCEKGICVNEFMQTNEHDIYAAGDVTGLSAIWPNAMKQGRIAARNMCGREERYTDTFAEKNTINFFGLVTLCLGRIHPENADEIVEEEDRNNYRRAILHDGYLRGILLQGDISNSGIWQYILKERIHLGSVGKRIFRLSFADFYSTGERGKYVWKS